MTIGDFPLTALVEYQVRTEITTVNDWLDVWQERGQDALMGEPDTSAYAAALSLQDESHVLVFERYAHGQTSIDAHVERPAHESLMETMGERNMTRRLVMSNVYADIEGYGWWDRAGSDESMSEAGISITLIGTRFADDAMKQRYIEVTGEHAEYCRDAEPGTLIYSGGLALRDSDRGPDINAGDMLFVAAFADDQAATQHRDDPRHVALQPALNEIERERTFLLSYKSTGKGYFWR
ncbi:MAG: quinol monooxygenase YgiN [Candidatus Azotimanducaceae bacterium]|jgi:quinol monooxygenase YgiN